MAAVTALCLGGSGCLTVNPATHPRRTNDDLHVSPRSSAPFRQGKRPVDEQDFYELAGDRGAVNLIKNERRTLVGTQMAWQGMGLLSIAGVGVGAGGLAAGVVWVQQEGPIGLIALLPGTFLMMGSIVAIPLSYVYAADAADAMVEPILPMSRAEKAADKANR